MKDFLGNEVQQGDKVACIIKNYSRLAVATVLKVTTERAYVAIESKDEFPYSYPKSEIKNSYQIIKI